METLNHLPCPVLVTDHLGYIQSANSALCALVNRSEAQLQLGAMDALFPLASRILLQTQVWPLLRSQGSVAEVQLNLLGPGTTELPVVVNAQRSSLGDAACYYWVFFVALERNRFEFELRGARQHAEDVARELVDSARFIQTITDALPSLVAYWDKDERCHFANKPYLEWFGIHPEDVIGSTLMDLLGPHRYALNEPYLRAVLAGEPQRFERSLSKADGSTGYTLAHYMPDRNAAGAVVGFFVLINDISSTKAAENELKLAASVFRNTVDGIMVTDADGVILSVNPAFSSITGYSAEEMLGRTPALLQSQHHDAAFYAAKALALARDGHWAGELWSRRKNGEAFLEWQTITSIPGSAETPTRFVTVFNDITERWHKDERIRHLALHDPLTDLPNRQLLMERLGQSIAKTEREPRPLALMFLDLDQFKQVNDTLGHDRGDELLVRVAQKLLSQVRQNDTVARLGGDEFVILLDNPLSQDYVAQIAARIVDALHAPLTLGDQQVQLGASIGIAMHPRAGATPAELLKNADAAMYAAKRAGKNTHRFFNAES